MIGYKVPAVGRGALDNKGTIYPGDNQYLHSGSTARACAVPSTTIIVISTSVTVCHR